MRIPPRQIHRDHQGLSPIGLYMCLSKRMATVNVVHTGCGLVEWMAVRVTAAPVKAAALTFYLSIGKAHHKQNQLGIRCNMVALLIG